MSSKIPPYLLKLVAFACGFLALAAAFDTAFAHLSGDDVRAKYAALFGPGPARRDIILGSSHAMRGVDPRYLEREPGGRQFFNFAYEGAGPGFYKPWYALYRRYQGKPDRVLLCVDWFMFRPYLWRHLAQDSEYLPADVFLAMAREGGPERRMLLLNRFPLIKQRAELQSRLTGAKPVGGTVWSVAERGFANEEPRPMSLVRPPWQPDREATLQVFLDLLAMLRADGARLVFVELPEYLPLAGEHRAENQLLARIARTNGIPFLNFNAELRGPLNLAPGAFNDWGHLNRQGAALFGPRLAAALAKHHAWERPR